MPSIAFFLSGPFPVVPERVFQDQPRFEEVEVAVTAATGTPHLLPVRHTPSVAVFGILPSVSASL